MSERLFKVTAKVAIEVTIKIMAVSFEDALAQAKELGAEDFVSPRGSWKANAPTVRAVAQA